MDNEVPERHRRHHAARFVWGLFLIGIGAALLAQHLGRWSVGPLYDWWPLIVIAFGVIRVVEWRPGSGLFFILLGSWFYVCQTHWHGITYADSWPVVIVAFGLKIVVSAVSGERRWGRRHGGSCCV